jgi:outer membrane immunogenic protein
MTRISLVLPAMAALALSVSSAALAAEGGSWAGAYGGLHVGYGMASDDNINTTGQAAGNVANVASGARPASVSVDADGFTGGVALGYNMQSGNMVYGLETDIDLTDIEDSSRVGTVNPAVTPIPSLTNTFKQDLEYLGTVRLRLGTAVNNGNTLVYATGGWAYGGIKNRVSMTGAAPANVVQFTGSNDEVEYGWVLGAGMEHALDAKLRFTASYMYYDLGSNTVNVAVVPGSGGGGTGYNSKFDTSGHLLRAGIGYQF